jgi:two-component system CitB family sensor kinase
VRGLADALRAQEHEFQHRLHVISGLIELGRTDEAVQFINRSSTMHQELASSLVDRVGDPVLVALLLGKAAAASERGVELRVNVEGQLPNDVGDVRDLVTVIGNLVDNALESVASVSNGVGWIEVTIAPHESGLAVRVHDSGPGIAPELVDEIFRDGFTTKVARGAQRRGLGLALVSQAARRRGGYVTVENSRGALFTVYLPAAREPEATRA